MEPFHECCPGRAGPGRDLAPALTRIAGVKSEVLVTGAKDEGDSVVLAGFDHPVPNGTRLF